MAGGSVMRNKLAAASKASAPPPSRTGKKRANKAPPTEQMEKSFGAVGRLSAAPTNIGTTIRSVPNAVKQGRDSVIVEGRDFVTPLMGVVSTNNNWVLSGGFPVSPFALTASILKGYFLTYQQFKFRRLVLHYISSSPTNTAGDVLMLHHDNRGGPYVDQTSANFLSYAMSTPSAVLGPQWLNKSVEVVAPDTYGWLSTDLLNAEDVQHQAAGEVLVYTKNTTNGTSADQPGYVLIDYEVEFVKKMVNPRSVSLPTSLGKIWLTSTLVSAVPVTGSAVLAFPTGGTNYDGTTGSWPTGIAAGQIYKLGFDVSNSGSWTNVSVNTLAVAALDRTGAGAQNHLTQVIFKTGMTLYGVYESAGSTMVVFPTYDAALAGDALYWGTSATVSLNMPFWMSLVGSLTSGLLQSAI